MTTPLCLRYVRLGVTRVFDTQALIKKYASIALAFAVCGVLHVCLYGVVMTTNIVQLYTASLAVLWEISIQRRVVDQKMRRLLLALFACLVLYLVLQCVRYRIPDHSNGLFRMVGYAYYVPMLGSSTLALYVGIIANAKWDSMSKWLYRAPAVIAVSCMVLMLTNDLHHQAYWFDGTLWGDSDIVDRSWVYYAINGINYLFLVLSYVLCLRASRRSNVGRMILLPIAVILLEVSLIVLILLDLAPRIAGIRVWQMGETTCYFTIALVESYIDIGLIPANRGYDSLFASMSLPAEIRDASGTVQYRSAGADHELGSGENAVVHTHAIRGGSVVWETDLTNIRHLERELGNLTASLDAKNDLLRQEGQIRREKTELETRNQLYDQIKVVVAPQLAMVDEILKSQDDLSDYLPRIAVLGAYVKRRSNLQLLAPSASPLDELVLATRESLRYVRLCGIFAEMSVIGSKPISLAVARAAYEDFERIVEWCLDSSKGIMVTLLAKGDTLTVRYLVSPVGGGMPPRPVQAPGVTCTSDVVTQDDDVLVLHAFRCEGGA